MLRSSMLTARLISMAILTAALSVQAVAAKVPLALVGDQKVKLEVASTPEQIQRGLMYRTALPENNGMVFLFRPGREVRFWMAHCFISLDMLFIKDGKVIKISENVPPCKAAKEEDCPTYPSDGPIAVTEVLEVNAGWAKRHNVKAGDSIKFVFDK